MNCILKACPWGVGGNCKTLGECGAAHALAKAAEPGGYAVLARDNTTIRALVKAGFVTTRDAEGDRHLIVTAKPKAVEFEAKQGRIEAAA